jgi:SAM-dependent methyltransferase
VSDEPLDHPTDPVRTTGAEIPAASAPTPAWFAHRTPQERVEYAHRFRKIADAGDDVDGEARFMDALAERGATILDAGCGVGRVAAALARVGHEAAGVDADPTLIAKGREFYPTVPLATLDLWHLTPAALSAAALPAAYDLVICAGNVMLFVAPETHAHIVSRIGGVLRPGGRAAFGFFTGRDYTHDHLDADAGAAGLIREHRFATWQCHPFTTASDWAVSVYVKPS